MGRKSLAGLALALTCLGTVFAARHFFSGKVSFTAEERNFLRARGEPAAPVRVVEYMDYQCGACRNAAKTLEAYLKKHPSDIFLQVRFYPLENHRHGLKAALYAECAARQGRFWKWHPLILDRQKLWEDVVSDQLDTFFEDYVAETGLDLARLRACVRDKRTEEALLQEKNGAKALGVSSTPSFFVNGKRVVLDELASALDKELSARTGGRK